MAEVKFPSNDQVNRTTRIEDRPKMQPINVGPVVQQKKTLARKFADTFLGPDVVDIKTYMKDNVIIPGIKNIVCDIFYGFSSSIETMLFGVSSPRRPSAGGYTSYGSYYQYGSKPLVPSARTPASSRQPQAPQVRQIVSFDNIILPTSEACDQVLDLLIERIETFGSASVNDLNDLLQISGNFTDNYWGWENLSKASKKRVRGGWMLLLPNPIQLSQLPK